MNKPYSESCDQNREPILTIISPLLKDRTNVLEIGSGTGQHAIYFAHNMPHIRWQTSDCLPYIDGINRWISDSGLTNVVPPIELNVSTSAWPELNVDAVFTANSLHIMSAADVSNLIEGVGKLLQPGGDLIIYGPFNYNGEYTSESNARFDEWLKSRDHNSGIRDFESVVTQAANNAMTLVEDYAMPANNRILHFVKS